MSQLNRLPHEIVIMILSHLSCKQITDLLESNVITKKQLCNKQLCDTPLAAIKLQHFICLEKNKKQFAQILGTSYVDMCDFLQQLAIHKPEYVEYFVCHYAGNDLYTAQLLAEIVEKKDLQLLKLVLPMVYVAVYAHDDHNTQKKDPIKEYVISKSDISLGRDHYYYTSGWFRWDADGEIITTSGIRIYYNTTVNDCESVNI